MAVSITCNANTITLQHHHMHKKSSHARLTIGNFLFPPDADRSLYFAKFLSSYMTTSTTMTITISSKLKEKAYLALRSVVVAVAQWQ